MRSFGMLFCAFVFALFTLTLGCVYLSVQQNFRMNANDPQIEIAQDASRSLAGGLRAVHDRISVSGPVPIERSLAPWLAVFTSEGRVRATSGLLNGAPPSMPAGVFAFVRAHGEDRVTWQPQPGIRSALIVTQTPQGAFVVAGRSLREVEKRESNLEMQVGAVWVLGALFCCVLVASALRLRNQPAG